jgi:hypothetical protein
LQIVPVVSSVDIQDRTVLLGSGFVEGASTYNFAGVSVVDTPSDQNNIDVGFDQSSLTQNVAVYLNRAALPVHGIGIVTVTTAGGTSAALALNTVRVSVAGTSLGDVAVDASGNLWVSDYSNPGHLLKIDPATGATLQTITLTAAFNTPALFNLAGLQILRAPMTLGATAVPAGSLLVFNGASNPDNILAVSPTTGAVIATLFLTANYDLTGATFDAASGRIFLTENNGPGNRIIAIDPSTGAQTAVTTVSSNIQVWSGLAINPNTGHLWLGSYNAGGQLSEYSINAGGTLTLVSNADISGQGVNQNEISGLSFDASGTLWVSSIQGEIYKVTL